jgi:hypothetical protein
MAGAFLLTLTRWCRGLEQALASIRLEDLSPHAATLAQRLRRAHGLDTALVHAGARGAPPVAAAPAGEHA